MAWWLMPGVRYVKQGEGKKDSRPQRARTSGRGASGYVSVGEKLIGVGASISGAQAGIISPPFQPIPISSRGAGGADRPHGFISAGSIEKAAPTSGRCREKPPRSGLVQPMIVHQHEGVEDDRVRPDVILELPQEPSPVVVIEEDPRPPVSTGGDVVDGVGEVDTWRTRHTAYSMPVGLANKV